MNYNKFNNINFIELLCEMRVMASDEFSKY